MSVERDAPATLTLTLPFSILSKILTVSESTLIYRKRLRSIYRDYQNEQRTMRQMQYGRLKYVRLSHRAELGNVVRSCLAMLH